MANKIMKSTLASVLAVISAATYVPGTAIGSIFADTAVTANADAVYGDFNYEVLSDGTVSVTKYTGSSSTVTIPSQIDGKTVTKIGNNAFIKNNALTEISIPSTVTEIGNFAFCSCAYLKRVIVPSSVTTLGRGAFATCPSLSTVILSDNLTAISEGAFQNCPSLTSITIPKNVTSIEPFAFQECEYLQNVTFKGNITTIGKKAFYKCENLKGIVLPSSLTDIGEYAFFGCSSMNKIYFNEGLKTIGDSAFGSCSGITNIDLPSTLTTIGNDAFANDKLIESITIPDSVTSIGKRTFTNCHALSSVTLSKNLTAIPQAAFATTGITYIEIPEGVTAIDGAAFFSCKSLVDIVLPSTLKTISAQAFNNSTVKNVTFHGSQAKWNAVEIGENNDVLASAKMYFFDTVSNPTISYQKGDGSVKLTWTEIKEAEKYGVAGLVNGKWTMITKTTGTSYVINDLKAGTDYKVVVFAMKNGQWNMDDSNAIVVTPNAENDTSSYPTVSKIEYNDQYHQFRVIWNKVSGATQYGIAVKLAGRWKVQAYTNANTNYFTSPKLKAGSTYQMVVCAKVNGEWDISNIGSRAFTVTVK